MFIRVPAACTKYIAIVDNRERFYACLNDYLFLCCSYGSLPPETRTQQARLFNHLSEDYPVLVASDAVGMGLNLYALGFTHTPYSQEHTHTHTHSNRVKRELVRHAASSFLAMNQLIYQLRWVIC